MKTLVRLMSVCSLVTAGVLATPAIASADAAPVEGLIGTTAQAHSHGSKMRMFDRALEAAVLRPEQRAAVDELKTAAKERHKPVQRAKRELMRTVADQIEEGKIDRCALEPQVDTLASAMLKAKKGDRKDFEKLHGILDEQQRGRFVESLKAQWEEMKRAHSTDAMLDKLDRELELTDDQRTRLHEIIDGLKQIREASAERAEYRERWSRILEAFKGDEFDLDAIAPVKEDAKERLTRWIDGRLWGGEVILPVLNEEQRTKLAKLLREKSGEKIEGERGTAQERRQPGEHEQEELEEQEEED